MTALERMLVPTKVSRQRKDVFRLEQEREKLGSELSEAQNMYMQSLEDVKVSRSSRQSTKTENGTPTNVSTV